MRGLLVLVLFVEVLVFWGNFFEVSNLRSSLAAEQSQRRAIAELDAPSAEDVRDLENTEEQNQQRLEILRTNLGPRYVHRFALGFWGTLPGIFVSVLLAGTLFGSEFRWDYWKMLALQEPRRGRIVLAKLLVLGLLILVGLVVLLLASYALNEIFLDLHDFRVDTSSPRTGEVAGWLGRAFLTTFAYGTVSAALTVASSSALAGFSGSLGLLTLDTFLQRVLSGGTSMFVQYAFNPSPAQQVANLFVNNTSLAMYGRVWFLAPQAVRLAPVPSPTFHLEVIPPSVWQGTIVLMVLVGIATLAAIIGIRRKEL